MFTESIGFGVVVRIEGLSIATWGYAAPLAKGYATAPDINVAIVVKKINAVKAHLLTLAMRLFRDFL